MSTSGLVRAVGEGDAGQSREGGASEAQAEWPPVIMKYLGVSAGRPQTDGSTQMMETDEADRTHQDNVDLLDRNDPLLRDFDHCLAREEDLSKTALSEMVPERWRTLAETQGFRAIYRIFRRAILAAGLIVAFAKLNPLWFLTAIGLLAAVSLVHTASGSRLMLHPKVRQHLLAHKSRLAQLRSELAAYQENVERVKLVKGRTELFKELCAACVQKRKELTTRTEAFLEGLVAVRMEHCMDPVERKRRKEAAAKLLHEQRELKLLADNLGSIVPDQSVGRFTKDLAPFIATLQAVDKVGEEAREAAAAVRESKK